MTHPRSPTAASDVGVGDLLELAPHGFALLRRVEPGTGGRPLFELATSNNEWRQLVHEGGGVATVERVLAAAAGLDAPARSGTAAGPTTSILEHQPDGRVIEFALKALGDSVIATARDVTDWFAAQEALATSEERYRTLVDEIDAIVSIENRETGVIWVSPQAERILGYPQALFAEPGFWRSLVVDEDRQRTIAVWDNDEGLDVYDLEYRMRHADGATIWLHERMKSVRGRDGKTARWYGIAFDITTLMSLRALREQSARLETMGLFAGGVAHDFKDLLFEIGMYTGIVSRSVSADDPCAADLDQLAGIVKRGKDLVASLLSFARNEPDDDAAVDPAAVARELEPLLRQIAGSGVEVCVSATPSASRVQGDRTQIERIVLNLVSNALYAMPDGGRLDVVVRPIGPPNSGSAMGTGWMRLTIRDTGSGMDEQTQARVFEPFFTTRERTVGSGLGLPTVQSIVSSLGGTIEIKSKPDVGTSVEVSLPRIAEPPPWKGSG